MKIRPTIKVDQDLKPKIKREATLRGMTQQEVTSRVLRWFDRMEPIVKSHILGQTDAASSAAVIASLTRSVLR